MKTEHILVIRFSALGDVAMTVPVVWAVAKRYPHVRITVLSRPFARTFFEGLAPNVSFMEADVKKEYKGVKGLNALYRRLVAKQFSAVADLHSILRSNYLRMRFVVDRYKVAHINKHRRERRVLTNPSHPAPIEQMPTSFENYADVFARLGYPVDISDPAFESLYTSGTMQREVLPETIGDKEAGVRWIGLAPFAAHAGKIYPLEKTEEVIRQLIAKEPNCRIFLFGGGKSEMETFSRWSSLYSQCTTVADSLKGFRQELSLMEQLDVMLSMDSANMHLASLVGTRVVSVWGATHPYAGFLGWRQHEEDVVQLDEPCRPCSIYGNKPCIHGDYRCLNGITPETIVARLISSNS